MPANTRFAVAIHSAGMLALAGSAHVSSETIARSVSTNPVVVRRVMALLAKHGLVEVRKGQTGGAALTRPPSEISLEELYRAVEPSPLVAVHGLGPEIAECPVAKFVGPVLTEFFASAEAGFVERLARFTLADVLAALDQRMAEGGVAERK